MAGTITSNPQDEQNVAMANPESEMLFHVSRIVSAKPTRVTCLPGTKRDSLQIAFYVLRLGMVNGCLSTNSCIAIFRAEVVRLEIWINGCRSPSRSRGCRFRSLHYLKIYYKFYALPCARPSQSETLLRSNNGMGAT